MNPQDLQHTEAAAEVGAHSLRPSRAGAFLHAGSLAPARIVPVFANGMATRLRQGPPTPVHDPELAWLEEPEALTPKTREDSMSTRLYCAICGTPIEPGQDTARLRSFLCHSDCYEEFESDRYDEFLTGEHA